MQCTFVCKKEEVALSLSLSFFQNCRLRHYDGAFKENTSLASNIYLLTDVDAQRHLAQAQTAEAAWQASQAEERVLHQAGWSGRF
jgi:hypothetical protein